MKSQLAAKFNTMYRFLNNKNVSMEDFWHRLRVQKTAYLLRLLGFEFSPTQSWYVRGPYSSSLATLAYEIDEMNEKPLVDLSKQDKKLLSDLKTIFGAEIKDIDKIELLVSVLYAIKEKQMIDSETITNWIIEKKPWYQKEEIVEMFNKIKSHKSIFQFNTL
jgi:uncharacterized protein YwgA